MSSGQRIAKRKAGKEARKYPSLGMGEDAADPPVPMPMPIVTIAAAAVALVAVAAFRRAKSEVVAGSERQPLLA